MKSTYSIADRLDDIVKEKGGTVTGDAAEMGISQCTLSDMLNDKRTNIKIDTLKKICCYYGISSDYLLGLSDVKNTNSDIKQINISTGLSEKAINQIIRMKESDPNMIYCLNVLLENDEVCDMIWSILQAKESCASGLQRFEKEYNAFLTKHLDVGELFSDAESNVFNEHIERIASLSSKYTFIPREDACKFYIQEAQNHLRRVIEAALMQEEDNA